MMFELIANEADFVVINKAENCNFHSEDGEAGLVVEVERALSLKLYSVHRLDKMTSGILILAKSSQAAATLTTLFSQRKMVKFYLAISQRKPNKKQGLIKGDMEKSRRGSWKLTKEQNNPALTQFFSESLMPGMRLFLLKPASGKTHQIRVALKSIAAPILGDLRYGQDASDRGYLHAYQLSFHYLGQDYFYQVVPNSGQWFIDSRCQQLLNTLGDLRQWTWPMIKI